MAFQASDSGSIGSRADRQSPSLGKGHPPPPAVVGAVCAGVGAGFTQFPPGERFVEMGVEQARGRNQQRRPHTGLARSQRDADRSGDVVHLVAFQRGGRFPELVPEGGGRLFDVGQVVGGAAHHRGQPGGVGLRPHPPEGRRPQWSVRGQAVQGQGFRVADRHRRVGQTLFQPFGRGRQGGVPVPGKGSLLRFDCYPPSAYTDEKVYAPPAGLLRFSFGVQAFCRQQAGQAHVQLVLAGMCHLRSNPLFAPGPVRRLRGVKTTPGPPPLFCACPDTVQPGCDTRPAVRPPPHLAGAMREFRLLV